MRVLVAASIAAVSMAAAASAETVHFSVDPASPFAGFAGASAIAVPGPGAVPPGVVIPGSALGLIPLFDNLNALSFGGDPLDALGLGTAEIAFSVDRPSTGLPGSAVAAEAFPGMEAHGDVFSALDDGSFTNTLVYDESALGLAPGFFGDDLDALDITDGAPVVPYFSIDSLSATNGFGAGTAANDIFIGVFGPMFASGEGDIGLDPFDDIDGLALFDGGTIGGLDPGIDLALFSLSAFSPNTFTGGLGAFSPADVFITSFDGTFSLFATATMLGLSPTDDLNALDFRVNAAPPIPVAPAIWLLPGALGALALLRRRRRHAA